jgi:hypothetical protein
MPIKRSNKYDKYLNDVELWEAGQLGATAKYAVPCSDEEEKALDDALGLAPISLRLQKAIVAKLKVLAKREGLGYQTYIRQILTRHVRAMTKPAQKKKRA